LHLSDYKKSVEILQKFIDTAGFDKQLLIEQFHLFKQIIKFEQKKEFEPKETFLTKIGNYSPEYHGRTALIADIHGNGEGLQAVLSEIEEQKCDRTICLGDLVDGGKQNYEVVQVVRGKNIICVKGNHDAENDLYLDEETDSFLKALPVSIIEGNIIFTHESPRKKLQSITTPFEAWNVFQEIAYRIIFVGHIHRPAIYGEKSDHSCMAKEYTIEYGHPIPLEIEDRYIISIPPVGYTRDEILKIRYGIYDHDNNTIEFRIVNGPLLTFG
jgi:predicted phosphodiesterase